MSRVSKEKLQEIVGAFRPAECTSGCDDPLCPYTHFDSYGHFTRDEYLMAAELLALREAVKPFATFAEHNTDEPVAWRWKWAFGGEWRLLSDLSSGDAGNWNPEVEPEVIAARAALSASPAIPATASKGVPAGIRICPRRDGPCPHGVGCTYWQPDMDCSTEPREARIRSALE